MQAYGIPEPCKRYRGGNHRSRGLYSRLALPATEVAREGKSAFIELRHEELQAASIVVQYSALGRNQKPDAAAPNRILLVCFVLVVPAWRV